MADTLIDRFTAGAGKIIPVDHTGPSSYTTGGETLGASNNQTGMTLAGLGTIDAVLAGSLTESGTYFVLPKQVGTGTQKTWKLVWYTVAGGGGTFTGTPATLTGTNSKPTFTVKTGTALANGTVNLDADAASANVVGGTGITADRTLTTTSPVGTPTITMASYTPAGTVTATGLAEVSNATDLSAEVVRLVYVGR